MGLPFKALPLEQLQRQYRRMIKRIKFEFTMPPGPRPRPTELYSCIFDCEDGMRLVISKERITRDPEGKAWPWTLHVFAEGVPPIDVHSDDFLKLVPARFAEISGETRRLDFFGFPANSKVPHWGMNLEANNVRQPEM